ncbi:G6PD1 [Arabidopsis thaliana]|uniref:G6PD1 n=1 Tax=Arabidopsis thaliana TaxID=3702 RepID=A0A178UCH1_ARATH|nr:G6PD1 [Arabidopsis thaliana]
MATHSMIIPSSSSSSSSSSLAAAASPFKETLPLFSRSLTFPRKSLFSQVRLRFFAEKHSQLDTSNGCATNFASIQDCEFLLQFLCD